MVHDGGQADHLDLLLLFERLDGVQGHGAAGEDAGDEHHLGSLWDFAPDALLSGLLLDDQAEEAPSRSVGDCQDGAEQRSVLLAGCDHLDFVRDHRKDLFGREAGDLTVELKRRAVEEVVALLAGGQGEIPDLERPLLDQFRQLVMPAQVIRFFHVVISFCGRFKTEPNCSRKQLEVNPGVLYVSAK